MKPEQGEEIARLKSTCLLLLYKHLVPKIVMPKLQDALNERSHGILKRLQPRKR